MENVYCKHLDLDFELDLDYVKDLQNVYAGRDTLLHHEFLPDNYDLRLSDLLDGVGMYIWTAEVFYTPPNQRLGLHIDGPEVFSLAKLNWVIGAMDSTMAWYKLKDPQQPIETGKTPFGLTYAKVDQNHCDLVWQDQIGQPSLVEAGQFHMVDNHNSMGRWCLSHALGDKKTRDLISWSEARDRLAKYII